MLALTLCRTLLVFRWRERGYNDLRYVWRLATHTRFALPSVYLCGVVPIKSRMQQQHSNNSSSENNNYQLVWAPYGRDDIKFLDTHK